MKDLASELLLKALKTPAVAEQVRKSLVNRDISIEIDGKKYQLMRKRNDDELDKLRDELTKLKSRLYDLEVAGKALLEVVDNETKEFERLNDLLYNQ